MREDEPTGLLTDAELAQVLRVSRATVSRAARDGRLLPFDPVYVAGIRRWRRAQVDAFVKGA